MTAHLPYLAACSLVLLLAASLPMLAADLIEPWERGFSDVELGFTWQSELSVAAAVVGFGLPGSVSLGMTAQAFGEGPSRWGIVGVYSGNAGRSVEFDVYTEVGIVSGHGEAELRDGADWLVGTEWSFHRGAVVPYFRLTALGDPASGGVHPLAGVVIPAGSRVELHLEMSGEAPRRGEWPLHVAVGPNVRVGSRLEVLPEISVLHDRAAGQTAWQVGLGLVLDPRGPAGR